MTAPMPHVPDHRSILLLFLGAPLVWALHLMVSYFLLTLGCRGTLDSPKPWLAILTMAALGTAVWIGLRARRASAALRQGAGGSLSDELPETARLQGGFLARTGVFLSAVFAFGILLTGLPLLLLPTCG